jgi:hypothetical protein
MHLAPTSAPPVFSELAFHEHLVRPGTIIGEGANIGAFSRPFAGLQRVVPSCRSVLAGVVAGSQHDAGCVRLWVAQE